MVVVYCLSLFLLKLDVVFEELFMQYLLVEFQGEPEARVKDEACMFEVIIEEKPCFKCYHYDSCLNISYEQLH